MANLHHSNGTIKWNELTGNAFHNNGVQAFNKLTGMFYDSIGVIEKKENLSFRIGTGISMQILPNLKITVYDRKVDK